MRFTHDILTLETGAGIGVYDITPQIREHLARHPVTSGFAIISSRHTTTALAINEAEERLMEDIKRFLARLVPRHDRYLHNDIHLRNCPPNEPENAHSHIAAMLLSSTETIPVIEGKLALGTWQSVLFIELDGPRRRTVTLQLCGE
jgi:secondary thiamine-phosphate synthase enzyme